MPRAKVLIGFAEALAAPEVLWSLVDAGFDVIAFSRKGQRSALRYSRHTVVHEISPPETNIAAAQADLRSLIGSLQSDRDGKIVVFPLDDTAVWLCAEVTFEGGVALAGPRGRGVDLAVHKQLQIQIAAEAGFHVPATTVVRTADEVSRFTAEHPERVILKPADCFSIQSGRVCKLPVWICANAVEVQKAVGEWAERAPLLAQPFIAGVGEGVFGFSAPDGVRAWSGHQRLRMMNPQGSGSSACVSQSVPADLKSQVERFIQISGWQGLFMIELLRDRSGQAWFIEFNGRPWGSIALARRQGLEYPAWNVEAAMGEAPSCERRATSTIPVVCRNIGREIMHLLFVLRGPKSEAFSEWPSFWRSLGEMISVRRGEGLYNWRREDPKVFMADCYQTIHSNLFKARH